MDLSKSKSILAAASLAAFFAVGRDVSAAPAAKPTPTPPVTCTNCWVQSTGTNGGYPVDLELSTTCGRTCVQTVFAAMQGGSAPGVYTSSDGGASFKLLKAFAVTYDILDYGTNGTKTHRLFAATSQGLYYSDDLRKWTLVQGGLPAGAVKYIGVTCVFSGCQAYATLDPSLPLGGLYRSLDRGASWTRVLPSANARAVAGSLGCASSNVVIAGGDVSPGSLSGSVWRSTDGGVTWGPTSFPSASVNDVEWECDAGSTSLAVTNNDFNTFASLWVSNDYGLTFAVDGSGLPCCRASNIQATLPTDVGTYGSGMYTRICSSGSACGPWSEFTTYGINIGTEVLGIVHWIKATDPVTHKDRYVAATTATWGPTAGYYFVPAP